MLSRGLVTRLSRGSKVLYISTTVPGLIALRSIGSSASSGATIRMAIVDQIGGHGIATKTTLSISGGTTEILMEQWILSALMATRITTLRSTKKSLSSRTSISCRTGSSGSLYPFISAHYCPHYNARETYFVDAWQGSGEEANLRSFERAHEEVSEEIEPPRVCWRLQPLRGWSYDKNRQVPRGNPEGGRPAGAG